MIDLHIHSTASDGSFSPIEILTLASRLGVKAISITDHDSISGLKNIFKTNRPKAPEIITGVEISCEPPASFDSSSSLHILGYGFSIYDRKLNDTLERLRQSRVERNPKIVSRLNELGFDFTIEDVESHFGSEVTGRPHIAEYMKEKGYVSSFREAFDEFLGKGKPAYVDKFKIDCKTAIQIIHDAGGVSVLAHPGLICGMEEFPIEELVKVLMEFGLKGLEVYYPEHSLEQTEKIEKIARDYSLLITGGSDFHGSFNQGIELGTGKGDLNIGYEVFRELKSAVQPAKNTFPQWRILEYNLNYSFKDVSFLKRAVSHRSYLNEHQNGDLKDNERLEFLGDAVIGLCVAQSLMETCPEKHEGDLSKLRASLVSEIGLADMARNIDLGRFIRLGKGEMIARGYEKKSILSDTFEAVIGAIYLDSGFDTTFDTVRRLFEDKIAQSLKNSAGHDYKSMLQELAQESGTNVPSYSVLNQTGPDHDKTFEVSLEVFGITAKGLGKTKKSAEQDAAKNALVLLKKIDA